MQVQQQQLATLAIHSLPARLKLCSHLGCPSACTSTHLDVFQALGLRLGGLLRFVLLQAGYAKQAATFWPQRNRRQQA